MGSLSFSFGLWLSYYALVFVCLFDEISELHAMDEKSSMTFSLESEHGLHL